MLCPVRMYPVLMSVRCARAHGFKSSKLTCAARPAAEVVLVSRKVTASTDKAYSCDCIAATLTAICNAETKSSS